MLKDYNIFYTETTQQKIVNSKECGEKGKNFPKFLLDFISLKEKTSDFVRHQDLIDNFDDENFVLFDNYSLLSSDTNASLIEFLKIKKIIQYVYKKHSAFFCKRCNTEFKKLTYDFLKDMFKNENPFLLMAFKIEKLTSEELEKFGINKIISKSQIFDIKNFKFSSTDFAIYKTIKFSDNKIKVNEFLDSLSKLDRCDVKIFVLESDKEKVKSIIDLKGYKKESSFICPKCFSVFTESSLEDKNVDYKYNGVFYDDFLKFSLNDILTNLKSVKQDTEILSGVIKRLEFLVQCDLGDLKAYVDIKELSFINYIKIFLSLISETLPAKKILVIKDISDELNFKEREDFVSKLRINFDKFIILSKRNSLEGADFVENKDFFNIKSYIELKGLKFLADIDNLYRKIVEIFLLSYDVKISNIKLSDFSKEKYNSFLNGEIKGEQFLKFKMFDLNFHQIMNTNIATLYDLFLGFSKVNVVLKKLCDMKMENDFLLDPISKITILNWGRIY